MDTFAAVFSAHAPIEWLLAIGAIFAATCTQFGIGIAFGLIAAPLLALIDIAFVPAPVLMLTCATATTGAFLERRQIRWDELRWSLSGRLAGAFIAIWVLSLLTDEKTFMLFFGLVIAAAVLLSVSGLVIPFSRPAIASAGLASGFTATITGVGGPPMAVVYQYRKAAEARPTLQAFFALGSAMSFAMLWASGEVSFEDVVTTVLLLPGFIAGYFAAPLFRPLFDRNFRRFLLGFAAVSAALLIWKGLA